MPRSRKQHVRRTPLSLQMAQRVSNLGQTLGVPEQFWEAMTDETVFRRVHETVMENILPNIGETTVVALWMVDQDASNIHNPATENVSYDASDAMRCTHNFLTTNLIRNKFPTLYHKAKFWVEIREMFEAIELFYHISFLQNAMHDEISYDSLPDEKRPAQRPIVGFRNTFNGLYNDDPRVHLGDFLTNKKFVNDLAVRTILNEWKSLEELPETQLAALEPARVEKVLRITERAKQMADIAVMKILNELEKWIEEQNALMKKTKPEASEEE